MNNNEALYEVRNVRDFRDLINQSVELFGDNTAYLLKNLQGEYYNVTYKELQADIRALGTALWSMDLHGKKIAVMGKNSYQWSISYLAVTCGLGVIVPIDKELLFSDIDTILSISEASVLLVDKKSYDKILEHKSELSPNIQIIMFDIDEDEGDVLSFNKLLNKGRALLEEGQTEYLNAEINPDELASLIFTSGTTGLAKGVMLSQSNICFVVMATASVVKILPEDRLLSVLPIHHTYECTLGFLMPLYSGSSIAFCEGLIKLMKNMQEVEPTVFVSVPLMFEKIHARIMKTVTEKRGGKFALSLGKAINNVGNALGVSLNEKLFGEITKNFGGKVRLGIVGAAAIRPDVAADFKSFGIPIYIGYGLTECAPLVAGNHDQLITADTVGKPLPNVELKIINPDSSGVGEICTRSPGVMLGYYNDEKSTKEVLDDEGWFHTGDLGSQDEEGIVRIMGRIKNVIVTKNGKNIYPEEVEFYLNNNPLIAEAMVVGNDDNENETVVEAKIFPDVTAIMEKFKLKEATAEDITRAVNDAVKDVNKKLPSYKNIKKFNIRDTEFIKTTTAKIKRYANMNDDQTSKDNSEDKN
ncbi:MAG: AMP-binding protein [Oscillospiraceae bacterium]